MPTVKVPAIASTLTLLLALEAQSATTDTASYYSKFEQASVLIRQGDGREAERILTPLLQASKKAAAGKAVYESALYIMASAKQALAQPQEAEVLLKEALSVEKGNPFPNQAEIAAILRRLSLLCAQQGRLAEARGFCLQEIEMTRSLFGDHDELLEELMKQFLSICKDESSVTTKLYGQAAIKGDKVAMEKQQRNMRLLNKDRFKIIRLMKDGSLDIKTLWEADLAHKATEECARAASLVNDNFEENEYLTRFANSYESVLKLANESQLPDKRKRQAQAWLVLSQVYYSRVSQKPGAPLSFRMQWLKKALPAAQEAVAIARELDQRDKSAGLLQQCLYQQAVTQLALGQVLAEGNSSGKAVDNKSDRDLLDASEKSYTEFLLQLKTEDDIQLDPTLTELATVYAAEHKAKQAESTWKRLLAIRTKTRGANDPSVAAALYQLGSLCYEQNQLGDAEKFYKQSLAVEQKLDHANKQTLSLLRAVLQELGSLKAGSRDFDEAAAYYEQALTIAQQELGTHSSQLFTYVNFLGSSYYMAKKFAQVDRLEHLAQSLAPTEDMFTARQEAAVYLDLAAMYYKLQKYDRMEAAYRKMLPAVKKGYSQNDPQIGKALSCLARACALRAKSAEAKALLERATSLYAQAPACDLEWILADVEFSIELLRQTKHDDLACRMESFAQELKAGQKGKSK